jgi:NTE family protein
LTNGGAYGNLGLEIVEKRCGIVLVSDAGSPFEISPRPSREWVQQSVRAFDTATAQARALRKRQLLGDLRAGRKQGTYWGTTTDIRKYGIESLPVSRASTELFTHPERDSMSFPKRSSAALSMQVML